MPSALERAAAEWLDTFDRREAAALRDLERHYRAARRSMTASIADALRRQQALERAGRGGVSYRYRRGRLLLLRRMVDEQIEALGGKAARTISARAQQAAEDAITWSRNFVARQLPEGAIGDLPARLVERAVALQARPGPLRGLLDEFGRRAGDRVGAAITTGLATGANPLVVARRIAGDVVETYRGRAKMITRTEMMRAVRHATRESFQADRDILDGWVWWSSLDRTTCAACWAMHGTEHGPDDLLDGHPGCRCTMVPKVSADAFPGVRPPDLGPTGEERFARLPREDQLAILGPGRYRLYADGQATLADMVTRDTNERWGTTRRVTRLRDLRARAGRPAAAPAGAAAGGDGRLAPSQIMRLEFSTTGRSARARADAFLEQRTRRAGEILDKVLRIPQDRTIGPTSVPVRGFGSQTSLGQFAYRKDPGNWGQEIKMSRALLPDMGPARAMNTALHEFGHYLDWIAPHERKTGPELTARIVERTATGGDLDEWLVAIVRSKGAQQIGKDLTISDRHRQYLLSAEELWARSFAQWAIRRGGTPDEYSAQRALPRQWADDEDFEPIARAIDNVMRSRGWLRE